VIGISKRTRQLVLPYDARVEGLIPHSQRVEKNGRWFLLIPHLIDETKVLVNLGYKAAPPILVHYGWRGTTPFRAQKVTAAMLTSAPRAYVLNDMGTGKTRSALYSADFLMREGKVRRALIVGPLSTLSTVWEHEIFHTMPDRESIVLHGTRKQRISRLEQDAAFYIINFDGVKTLREYLAARKDIDLVIVDELSNYRNKQTDRWKMLNIVVRDRPYVGGMTGTPIPNEPTDAWAQTKLITPKSTPPYFKQFRNQTMVQLTQFKWIPKKEATAIVNKAMRPAVRFSRDECVDMPPVTTTTYECELSKPQEALYKEMMSKFAVRVAAGEITAANAGVQMNKLLQICAGFLYNQGTGFTFSAPSREALLKELIEESGNQKFIIFAGFKYIVRYLAELLEPTYSLATITGDTPKAARDEAFYLFQNSDSPRLLVAHPGTMSHGLNLQRANNVLWYTPPRSLEEQLQANARITRPGQAQHMNVIQLVGSNIERAVYARLARRESVQDVLLDMFEDQRRRA
jgi:SNF2 family DNA or RNA helicase